MEQCRIGAIELKMTLPRGFRLTFFHRLTFFSESKPENSANFGRKNSVLNKFIIINGLANKGKSLRTQGHQRFSHKNPNDRLIVLKFCTEISTGSATISRQLGRTRLPFLRKCGGRSGIHQIQRAGS